MGRTYLQLWTRLAEKLGEYESVSTTTPLAASKNVLSTTLAMFPDDWWNDRWLWINESNNLLQERHINDFTSSSGTCAVDGANFSVETAAVSVYLTQWRPTWLRSAIIDAMPRVLAWLPRYVADYSIIGNNPIRNCSFDDWDVYGSTGPPDNWNQSNALMTTSRYSGQEIIMTGSSVLKMLNRASNPDYIYQNALDVSYPRYQGETFDAYAWVYCVHASRVTLDFLDGTQTFSSSAHGGTGWEKLKIENETIAAAATKGEVRISISTGTAVDAYVDRVWMETSVPLYIYDCPSSLPQGPSRVYRGLAIEKDTTDVVGFVSGHPNMKWLPYDNLRYVPLEKISPAITKIRGRILQVISGSIPTGMSIRLEGKGYLTIPDADSDVVEVDQRQAEILVSQAVLEIVPRLIANSPTNQTANLARVEAEARASLADLKQQVAKGPLAVTSVPQW